MSSYNGLTEAQEERLTLLIEECSEVIQAASKIKRFGYHSINPYRPEDGTNLNQLQLEMGDIDAIRKLMIINGDIDVFAINARAETKYPKLQGYLRAYHIY